MDIGFLFRNKISVRNLSLEMAGIIYRLMAERKDALFHIDGKAYSLRYEPENMYTIGDGFIRRWFDEDNTTDSIMRVVESFLLCDVVKSPCTDAVIYDGYEEYNDN